MHFEAHMDENSRLVTASSANLEDSRTDREIGQQTAHESDDVRLADGLIEADVEGFVSVGLCRIVGIHEEVSGNL